MERINRKDDESLYQPKIHSEKIRKLYQLKAKTGLAMTALVDLALAEFIQKYQIREEGNEGNTYTELRP